MCFYVVIYFDEWRDELGKVPLGKILPEQKNDGTISCHDSSTNSF